MKIKSELSKKFIFNDSVSIVLCGEAGQGIQTIQQVLTKLLVIEGYNVYTTKEYMSRIRGGNNSVEIRVSSKPVQGMLNKIDILIPLDNESIEHLKHRIGDDTLIIGDTKYVPQEYEHITIPFEQMASQIGNKIYSNTLAIGLLLSLFNSSKSNFIDFLKERFASKNKEIINQNILAAKKGYDLIHDVSEFVEINMNKNVECKNHIFLSGTDAIGMGAIAGGCNFICSYPMSPSTGVLVFLAEHSKEFGILVEQAEDEITAINAGLGASYGGARAIATTSGGGFALMGEGLSLAGMIETPFVIHISQRPGPATGLPTRTGQEDLNLALYTGHGEFPRIILAPGTLQDGFELTQKAFNLAEKYQVPVIILSDQYYVDTYYNTSKFDISKVSLDKKIIKTDSNYERYKLTSDGISPRGIPGYGNGVVCADSDEHTEDGHITEDLDIRVRMVEKRLKKKETMMHDFIFPQMFGPDDYEQIILCWGSTFPTVREAVELLNKENPNYKIAVFNFKQLYPLHDKVRDIISKAKQTFVIEGNATAQFANLIKTEFGTDIDEKILKYDGLQFTVEEVIYEMQKRI